MRGTYFINKHIETSPSMSLCTRDLRNPTYGSRSLDRYHICCSSDCLFKYMYMNAIIISFLQMKINYRPLFTWYNEMKSVSDTEFLLFVSSVDRTHATIYSTGHTLLIKVVHQCHNTCIDQKSSDWFITMIDYICQKGECWVMKGDPNY